MALFEKAHIAVASGMTVTGLLGNVAILLVSHFTSTFNTFEFNNLILFEIIILVCGPCMSLYVLQSNTDQFKVETSSCRAIEFFASFSQLGALLSVLFLMYCTRYLYSMPGQKVRRMLWLAMVLIWILSAIAVVIPVVIEKRQHFSESPHACVFIADPSVIFSTRQPLPFAILALVIHLAAFLFYAYVRRMKNNYLVQMSWDRHRVETQLNDPECTTVQISSSEGTSVTLSVRNTSPFGRRGRRVSLGEISLHSIFSLDLINYPLPNHRLSPPEGKARTEDSDDHARLNARKIVDSKKHPVKKSEDVLRLSPRLLETYEKRRQVFKSPVALNYSLVDQAHRDFKRAVFIIVCCSLIGCLPYCVTTFLAHSGKNIPDEAWLIVTWMLYFRSAVSFPICFICSVEYRKACRLIFASICLGKPSLLLCKRNRKAYLYSFPGSSNKLFGGEAEGEVRLKKWTQKNRRH